MLGCVVVLVVASFTAVKIVFAFCQNQVEAFDKAAQSINFFLLARNSQFQAVHGIAHGFFSVADGELLSAAAFSAFNIAKISTVIGID